MGLGLYGRVSRNDAESDLALIQTVGTEFAEASGLRNFFALRASDNRIEFYFHPAAEPVELSGDAGTLTLSAKTSGAGPGYHRFIVQFMDLLAERLEFQWTGQADGSSPDGTGFFEHRDFDLLQDEMRIFLRTLLSKITERRDWSGLMLNMPIGLLPRLTGVATPMGDWPMETLQLAVTDDTFLQEFARQFFPWWDKTLTAEAMRNSSIAWMWTDAKWHPPKTKTKGAASRGPWRR